MQDIQDGFPVGASVVSNSRWYRKNQTAKVLENAGVCVRLRWENGDTTITNSQCLQICQ